MSDDAFSTLPERGPVALLDLVETKNQDRLRAFVASLTRLAGETGGRVMLANEAIAPMIVPDDEAGRSDDAIGMLVVSQYPTREAGRIALSNRKKQAPSLSDEDVRTYAAQPVGRIESLIGRTLPYTLGLLKRVPVPKIDDTAGLDALIERARVLGEQPDETRWARLAERAGDRPIWMLNFLEFSETAVYAEGSHDAAPAAPISGARAYRRYGSGMIGSLAAVGGRVAWSGLKIGQLTGPEDGPWHQVAIALYPSAVAMMTMLARPAYRAAHVHRNAALARTRLLATQPIQRPA